MITIPITSSSHTYSVFISSSLYAQEICACMDLMHSMKIRKVAFVYDENCKAYVDILSSQFQDNAFQVHTRSFPSGESSKSIDVIYPFYSWLIENEYDRNSAIIALGGGVTGDAVGYIASTFLRGIPFFQFPTTLLAMVDSSVGGKVAINHELGKNLIGSFYPPLCVCIDTATLHSLPQREFICGLAECVKHAALRGDAELVWLEQNVQKICDRDVEVINELVARNIRIKASVVEADEKESGQRAFLNLGHTFAHALEKHYAYSNELLHGEAVSLGLVAAARLSCILGHLSEDAVLRLENILSSFSLPVRKKELPLETLSDLMKRDKKVKDSSIHFVLLKELGVPFSDSSAQRDQVFEAWSYITEER